MEIATIRGTGLSALPLITAFEDLAAAGQVGQVRALVAQRQAELAPFVTDRALSIQLQARQAELRQHVTHYLDRLVPETVRAVTELERCQAVVLSVREATSTAPADDGSARELLAIVLPDMEAAHQQARELARLVDRERRSVLQPVDALTAHIDGLVKALGDEKAGHIAEVEKKIADTNEKMAAAVQQAVASGQKIGAQVKKIVTWVFSMFSADGDKDKKDGKDKDKKKPEVEDGGDDPVQAKNPAEEDKTKPRSVVTVKKPEEPVPAESIGEISAETTNALDANSELNRRVVQLQALYRQLYTMNAALGIASVLREQARDYAHALARLEVAAGAVIDAWGALIEAARSQQPPGGELFDASWTTLDRRIAYLVRSLTGGSQAIPQLGRIDNVTPIKPPGEEA